MRDGHYTIHVEAGPAFWTNLTFVLQEAMEGRPKDSPTRQVCERMLSAVYQFDDPTGR